MSRCASTEESRQLKQKALNESHHPYEPAARRNHSTGMEDSVDKVLQTNHKLVLIVADGQEDAVIHGHRTRKERGSFRAGHGHMLPPGAERGTRRIRIRPGAVAGLERNAPGPWWAVRNAKAGVANKYLAVTAAGCTRGGFGHRPMRGVARRDRKKGDEAPRRTDRRQDILCTNQPTLRVRGNKNRGR